MKLAANTWQEALIIKAVLEAHGTEATEEWTGFFGSPDPEKRKGRCTFEFEASEKDIASIKAEFASVVDHLIDTGYIGGVRRELLNLATYVLGNLRGLEKSTPDDMDVIAAIRKLTREVETGREGRRAVAMKLVEIYNQPDDDLAEQAMTGFLMAVEFALQEAGISYHVDGRRIVVT